MSWGAAAPQVSGWAVQSRSRSGGARDHTVLPSPEHPWARSSHADQQSWSYPCTEAAPAIRVTLALKQRKEAVTVIQQMQCERRVNFRSTWATTRAISGPQHPPGAGTPCSDRATSTPTALQPSKGQEHQESCTPRFPIANEAEGAANEAPAADPALHKSCDGFEEDPSQEHAAGGGRERSFSGA